MDMPSTNLQCALLTSVELRAASQQSIESPGSRQRARVERIRKKLAAVLDPGCRRDDRRRDEDVLASILG